MDIQSALVRFVLLHLKKLNYEKLKIEEKKNQTKGISIDLKYIYIYIIFITKSIITNNKNYEQKIKNLKRDSKL